MKLDNFIYKDSYNKINENVFKKKDSEFLDNYVKHHFYKNGFFINESKYLKNEELVREFDEFSSILGSDPIIDANRRKKYQFNNIKKEQFASVDVGSSSISPHSEASFSPIRPAIISFLCLDISQKASLSGLTTLIDGEAVWNDLKTSTKKVLQSLSIKYYLKIDLDIKKNSKGKTIPSYLDYNNVSDVYVNTKEAKLEFNYKVSFLREHPITRKLSIANHAFVPLKQELQIKNRVLIKDGKKFDLNKEILKDIFNNIDKHTFTFPWIKGKSLIIDNFRFMHGRLGFGLLEKREIIIRQLKKFKV